MTKIISRYFGAFDHRDGEVVHFRAGLPGFEDQTHYAALSIPGQEPILYLQSTKRPELCLITVPARTVRQDYRLELTPEDRDTLGLPHNAAAEPGVDVACQVIVTVGEDGEPTANLAAPLVINLANHCGAQVFQAESDYSFRFPIAAVEQPVLCS